MARFKSAVTDKTIDGKKLRHNLVVRKAVVKDIKTKKGDKAAQQSVADILAKLNFCPFAELANLAKTARSEYVIAQCNAELAKYVRPQLKSIEHKGNADEPLNFVINL